VANELSTKMILVEDLVDKIKGRLLDKVVTDQKAIYKVNPHNCSKCNSKKIVGVEIMGARNGVLLWECEDCYEMFLKYEAEETKDYWTNPKDWGYIPRRKFN
jgi:ribosomal protein L37AE/L43A